MPHLQIVNNVKDNMTAYQNLLYYVARPDKCSCGLYGMTNTCLLPGPPPEQNLDQYYWALREFHCKDAGRYAMHFIIEFAPSEARHLHPHQVLELGYLFAQRAFPNLVCFFAVHDHACCADAPEQIRYHIDMMVFTVDIYTGLIYSCGKSGGYRMLHDFIPLLEPYIPKKDISAPIVFCGRT